MAVVNFTENLRKHLDCPQQSVSGNNVREILKAVFEITPRLEGYILDDQGQLRQHVNVFVDGQKISDRQKLSDAVSPTSEVYVIQALSGG